MAKELRGRSTCAAYGTRCKVYDYWKLLSAVARITLTKSVDQPAELLTVNDNCDHGYSSAEKCFSAFSLGSCGKTSI
jgi:hypothetical protein